MPHWLRRSQWPIIIGDCSNLFVLKDSHGHFEASAAVSARHRTESSGRRRISCSVYLIYDDDNNWTLIDIGYEDAVDDCLEIIRQLDFPFSKCVTLIASHADVDHIQGFAKAKQLLKTTVTCHAFAAKPLETGDKLMTYAEIAAQDIHLEMPTVKVERLVKDGDKIKVGSLELEVWHTPGHTSGQLSFRLGKLLFSGDNLFRDGCVGAIDAHHGSSISDFI